MMNRTHALTGACAYVAAAPVALPGAGWPLVACGAALCAVAATLPDLDHKPSTPSRWLRVPLWRFLSHRGITHQLWPWLVGSALLWSFCGFSWWTVALSLGWVMHHFGDMITVQGLYWLAPLKLRIRGVIHANGIVERWIFSACLLFLIGAGVSIL